MSVQPPDLPLRGVNLAQLVRQLSAAGATLTGGEQQRVTDVFQDSREVRPGSLFVARQGGHSDGLQFVQQAMTRGAVALMVDSSVLAKAKQFFPDMPIVAADDLALALAIASEAIYHWPSRQLCVVGVTGTNGKTTLTWLVAHLLKYLGLPCGQIGTLGTAYGERREAGTLTTPQADHLSRTMAAMRDAGITHVVMEVSNVALVHKRVEALHFDVAAFTNFSRDHLDFHGTVDAYYQAKCRLFTSLSPTVAVLNIDDEKVRDLVPRTASKVLRVGHEVGADVDVSQLTCTKRGIEGTLHTPQGSHEIRSPLLGAHNIENLSVAFGIITALGLDLHAAAEQVLQVNAPPGRLERCDGPLDCCTVLVDYAHTPDALVAVLDAMRAITDAPIVCVFGCGGDRDPGKRELMGKVVAERADRVVLTNDNPRTESPEAIAAMVEVGIRKVGAGYELELDRALAIQSAVFRAQPGDWILIAGKGHENYQDIGTTRIDFDDRKQAQLALSARRRAVSGHSD